MPSFKAFADFQKKTTQDGPGNAAKTAGGSPAAGADKPAAAPAAEAAPPPVKSDEPLKIGMKVKVCGLQARPELNGLEGVLTSFDEQRSRWQVELKNGGGAKLFKAANLEQHISDEDALDILKGRKAGPATGAARAGAMGAAPAPAAQGAAAEAPNQELDGRDTRQKAHLDGGAKYGTGDGPSAAAVAAAAAIAKGGKVTSAEGEEEDDDEAFVQSIEQCLKECDVMWDDY
eukprot:CAMPEP_0171176572 /NCGR_PEP_ID=MMETSP0790-20130122/11804_1 /TAXON_ID=2925 /ORGANISM="Alexandrium catenella, Strain OF101" /LENGTH=230 /DNA_ID=CAMNT_0011641465 /DNA_START=60 /DNA_END=752 /DNA_ORIENTATION=-